MASASKTPNLNLPQWVAEEKPERTDFNAAFLAIDGDIAQNTADIATAEGRLDDIEAVNDPIKSAIVDLIYPVGAIYISVVSTSPATLFGGTWEAFGAGKTLVGLNASDADFDTAEDTGGAKTHTLTVSELPSTTLTLGGTSTDGITSTNKTYNVLLGGGAAHNNLQPYIVTYMWKRTA